MAHTCNKPPLHVPRIRDSRQEHVNIIRYVMNTSEIVSKIQRNRTLSIESYISYFNFQFVITVNIQIL